jgi:AMP deaminase
LPHISGFDSVDDESANFESIFDENLPPPKEWDTAESPPYAYYLYYMWANIATLNKFREMRGLSK